MDKLIEELRYLQGIYSEASKPLPSDGAHERGACFAYNNVAERLAMILEHYTQGATDV